MESVSFQASLPFKTPLAVLNSRFGITMNEEDYLELAYPIYKSIGSLGATSKIVSATILEDNTVKLPEDYVYLKSVVLPFKGIESRSDGRDVKYSGKGKVIDSVSDLGHPDSNRNYIESGDHVDGYPLAYEFQSKYTIKIVSTKAANKSVMIVYGTYLLDDEGLPFLTDKEIEALLYTIALQYTEKQVFKKIPGAIEMLQYLSPLSMRALAAARIPEALTENEIDAILEVKSSWDRKTYGKRYKLQY